jgi:hypothetical protein
MFSFASLYHDSQSSYWKQSILKFAAEKLSLGAGIDGRPITRDAALAVLAVRCLLEFNGPTEAASRIPKRLVEAHMRIVYAIPEHRNYVWSGYSSEPVLAEAAGRLMQDHEEAILQYLQEAISDRLILGRGDCGKFEARLRFMLAYSDALREVEQDLYKPMFHRPVRLLDFLRNLFSKEVYARLSQMHDGDFEDDFADAYIHFSHFVLARNESMLTPTRVAAALSRGMAYQSCSNQAAFDIVIPVVFGKNNKLASENLSFVVCQVKNLDRAYFALAVDTFDQRMKTSGFQKPALYLHIDLVQNSRGPLRQILNSSSRPPTVQPIFYEIELPTRRSSRRCEHPAKPYIAGILGRGPETYCVTSRHAGREKVLESLSTHIDPDVYTDHIRKDDRDARDALAEMKPSFTEEDICWRWWRDAVDFKL